MAVFPTRTASTMSSDVFPTSLAAFPAILARPSPQGPNRIDVDRERRQAETAFELRLQPFPIAQGVVQAGSLQFDVAAPDGRLEGDGDIAGGLADDLLAGAGLFPNEDQQVSQGGGPARPAR